MKKITAIVLSMLMVIGMVGNVFAEYTTGSIAGLVKSELEAVPAFKVDVDVDVKAKNAGAGKYSSADVVEIVESTNGRTFDFTATVDLSKVKSAFEAGKNLAKMAFAERELDVNEYMNAFGTLNVTGDFEVVATYDPELSIEEATLTLVVNEELFKAGEFVFETGKVTIPVSVVEGVTVNDIEKKLFSSKLTLTCEGAKASEIAEYPVTGSFTGETKITEGGEDVAVYTFAAVEDTVTAKITKRTGGTYSDDTPSTGGSTGTTKPEKEPEATVKDDVVTVPKDYKEDKVTVSYKAPEKVVADTIVVVNADGEVIEATYDAEKGTVTFPAGEAGKYTIEAATEEEVMILTIDDHDAHVFGEEKTNDVAPKIKNDRTMLPARFVAEHLGATVAWDEAARKVTITKDDIVIEITIDAEIALVNGEEVKLDSPAYIENDRTYTPIRFISENLGAKVFWNGTTQNVTIVK